MRSDVQLAIKEERMNAITHGAGILGSIIAFVMLIQAALEQGDLLTLIGGMIYGTTLILMFTISTIMHSLPFNGRKKRFVMYDHMSIYVFIAGSYTPFLLISMDKQHGLPVLVIIWASAIAGIIYKWFYTGKHMWLSTLGYLVMGWFVAVLWSDLHAALGVQGLKLLVAGGACYTLGIVFFVWEGLRYHHAIWHLFVLAGAALHYVCVYMVISGG